MEPSPFRAFRGRCDTSVIKLRRSRAGGNPCGGGSVNALWIPADAGMTRFLWPVRNIGYISWVLLRNAAGGRLPPHPLQAAPVLVLQGACPESACLRHSPAPPL